MDENQILNRKPPNERKTFKHECLKKKKKNKRACRKCLLDIRKKCNKKIVKK